MKIEAYLCDKCFDKISRVGFFRVPFDPRLTMYGGVGKTGKGCIGKGFFRIEDVDTYTYCYKCAELSVSDFKIEGTLEEYLEGL